MAGDNLAIQFFFSNFERVANVDFLKPCLHYASFKCCEELD